MNMKKRIWTQEIDLKTLNEANQGTLTDLLGIVFTEIGDDYLVATMPVTTQLLQPMGIMHGGASCTLAETIASIAANLCIDRTKKACVGLDININHIRPVYPGTILTAITKPLHLGRTTQVWEIKIQNENKLVAVSRMTASIIDWGKE